MIKNYCGSTERISHGAELKCGAQGPNGGTQQCSVCEKQDRTDELQSGTDKPELAIARVAHEVVRNVAVSFGDYSTPPWDQLPTMEQLRLVQLVGAYLATPSLKPDMLTIAIPDQQTRTKDYALFGVVRAIAQEQSRV